MADEFMSGFMAGQNDNGGKDDGMGGGFMMIFLLVILAMSGGGGGLFGGKNDNGSAATKTDLCEGFNFNNLEVGVRGVQNGLCDGFYAQNTTLMNGFHGVDTGLNSIAHQISDCCCTTQRNIDQSRYEMSKGFCDVIQSAHSDADRVLAFLGNEKFEAMRDRAMAAEAQLSQNAQSRYLVDTVRPCPVPAYPSCNPWGCTNGLNNGCGCGV